MIPYLDRFSIIGTTDVEYQGDPREVAIDDSEIAYLLEVYNKHFTRKLKREEIVWTYSGVRPLCDDESDSPQAITRDYTLELQQEEAPLLSIFGGKLTTYRKLAEAAMAKLAPFFPDMGDPWTAQAFLPGGEAGFDGAGMAAELQRRWPWLSHFTAQRLATNYGTRSLEILDGVGSEAEMGQHFGEGFYARELDYLIDREFVQLAEDALWRRSKLGLYLNTEQQQAVADYIRGKCRPHRIAAA